MQNRIEEGLREWQGHQKRLTDLFGASICGSRALEMARLEDYRKLLRIPIHSLSKEERVMRIILKAETGKLEKTLYPSFIIRMVKRFSSITAMDGREMEKKAEPAPLVIKSNGIERKNEAAAAVKVRKSTVAHELLPKNRIRKHNGIKRS